MFCEIDIFIDGRWITAARFEVADNKVDEGIRGAGLFDYDVGFAGEYLDHVDAAISCRLPVNFEQEKLTHWPAFLLDMLPSGAARREITNQLGLPNGPTADWPLLLRGAGNPVGNLRITQAIVPLPTTTHPGFAREDVIERGDGFIEYARQGGAAVSGSSGAQGDAPKFLLVEDFNGRWHADRALPDEQVAAHWLVKFPRAKQESDRRVLKNEEAFYKVAAEVGLNVGCPLQYEQNTLFIPRFDREVADGRVLRFGMESLCAAAGIAEFGAKPSQFTLLETIALYSTRPQIDVEEFIMRDILNVAMGNTDNHPRNSAFIKKGDEVRLSPLFDFAPMILDDQGIARCCRWQGLEQLGRPNWMELADSLNIKKIDNSEVRGRLTRFAVELINLPDIMENCGVDTALIEQLDGRIKNVQENLRG